MMKRKRKMSYLEDDEGTQDNEVPVREKMDIFPIQDLPVIILRKIIKMLPKSSRDNLRLSFRWFGSIVVRLDATYRNLKIPLNYTLVAKRVLDNINAKEVYINNAVHINFELKCDEWCQDPPTIKTIMWQWRDKVKTLNIKFCYKQSCSVPIIYFRNLKHLDIRDTMFIPRKLAEVSGLIERHAKTLQTLRLVHLSELNLSKKLAIERLTVVGLNKTSLTNLLKLCCDSLIHLDLSSVLMEANNDCIFTKLKYLSFSKTSDSFFAEIMKQCAKQLVGLKILCVLPEDSLKHLNMSNLKFLYIDFPAMYLPKCLPSLEFLRFNHSGTFVASHQDYKKLTSLKALIVPCYDEWTSQVMKSSKNSLDFVHFLNTGAENSGSTDNDLPKNIKLLCPNDNKDVSRQWLLDYVKNDSLYSRMLQTAVDDNKLERFNSYELDLHNVDEIQRQLYHFYNWVEDHAHFDNEYYDNGENHNDMSDEESDGEMSDDYANEESENDMSNDLANEESENSMSDDSANGESENDMSDEFTNEESENSLSDDNSNEESENSMSDEFTNEESENDMSNDLADEESENSLSDDNSNEESENSMSNDSANEESENSMSDELSNEESENSVSDIKVNEESNGGMSDVFVIEDSENGISDVSAKEESASKISNDSPHDELEESILFEENYQDLLDQEFDNDENIMFDFDDDF